MRINDKLDGSSLLFIDHDIGEFRHTGDINAILPEVPGCQYEGLHGLVDGTGSNGLYFGMPVVTDHTGNGAGNGEEPSVAPAEKPQPA